MEFAETMIKMIKLIIKFYDGQTTLEVGMAIALAIVLVVATMSIWNYFNKVMVERYQDYNSSRLAAVKDITGSTFGMQPGYLQPKLNIFSLAGSPVGDAPPQVPPDEGNSTYQNCYDDLNASLTTWSQLQEEIINLSTFLILNISQDTMNLKAELGGEVGSAIFFSSDPSTAIFCIWLYGGDGQGFFNDTFYTIENKFDYVWQQSWYKPNFFKPFDPDLVFNGYFQAQNYYDYDGIKNAYIIPGKALEDQGSLLAQEITNKTLAADSLFTQAWNDFYNCTGTQPNIDPCYTLCQPYMDNGDGFMQLALQALASGNLGQYQYYSGLAQAEYGNYTVCFDNCTNTSS